MDLPLKTIGGSEVSIITLKNTYPCLYTLYTFLTLNEYSNEGAGLKILYNYVVEAKTEGSLFYTISTHVDNIIL